MEIDRGLKIRIVISVVLVMVLLAVFVERLSYRSVIAHPREPASTGERVIESCDDAQCAQNEGREPAESPGEPEEGALIQQPTSSSGA